MPVLLKKTKDELAKFPRKLTDYTKLGLRGPLDKKVQQGLNAVTFAANVASEEDPSLVYRTTIQFFKVEYKEEDFKDSVKMELEKETILPDGYKPAKHIFMKIPTVRGNGVRMKCACPDFRFNFEKQLYDEGGLIGNWRKYKRKTPPNVRPAKPRNPNPIGADYKNPENYLGMCKHLYSLLVHLKSEGLVKER